MSDQYITNGDTVYFHFASNDTSGSGGDGASAAVDVRECGALASAASITTGVTASLLSDASYPAGCYEVEIDTTTGYSADKVYAVFCTLAVDSQNPTGFIGRFHTKDVQATLDGELVTLAAATHTGAVIPTVTTLTGHIGQTGDSFARIGANGASLTALSTAAELAKVPKSDGVVTWNATALGSINTQADTALTDYDAPTYDELEGFMQLALRSDAAIETDRSTLLSAINANEGSGAGDYSAQTEAQEAIRDHVGDGTTLTEAGGTGDQLTALATAAALATVDTEVGNIQTDLDNGTDGLGALKSLIDALNDLSAAEVNAEMVDVITVDAISEIAQGVPSSTPNLADAVMLLYMALRNKLDVATSGTDTLEIHNDAGTRICQKLLTDDGSDYSEAKVTSGA